MPLSDLREKGMWSKRLEKIVSVLPNGAWIAGGFLRSIIAGEDELDGDIDIFFNSEEAFKKTLDLIKSPTSAKDAERAFCHYAVPANVDNKKLRVVNCKSLINFRPDIQLIRLFWFDSAEHVIDAFDFTVCQFITDGKTLWFGENSFSDVKSKKLILHRETGDILSVLSRLLKYKDKGYRIDEQKFKEIEGRACDIVVAGHASAMDAIQKRCRAATQNSIIGSTTVTNYDDGAYLRRALEYLKSSPAMIDAKTRKEGYGQRGFNIADGTLQGLQPIYDTFVDDLNFYSSIAKVLPGDTLTLTASITID